MAADPKKKKTQAKPAAKMASKPAAKKAPSKSKGKDGPAGFDMHSYIMGAAHGAQILMQRLGQQGGSAMQQMGQQAQGAAGQAQGAANQLGQSAFGDNGMLPVGRIGQGMNSLNESLK